jgi:hypothetical protein
MNFDILSVMHHGDAIVERVSEAVPKGRPVETPEVLRNLPKRPPTRRVE